MHTLDRSFKRKKEAAAVRRRKTRLRRIALAVLGLVVLAAIPTAYYTVPYPEDLIGRIFPASEETQEEPEVAPQEYVYAPTIVDLAGDPLIIRLGGDDGLPDKLRSLAAPQVLVGEGVGGEIKALSDTMLNTGVQLMTTLPSRPQDFAFFRAQKSGPARPGAQEPEAGTDAGDSVDPDDGGAVDGAADGDIDAGAADGDKGEDAGIVEGPPTDDAGAGWGETIDHETADLPDFKKTRIEDTTSIAIVVPEGERYETTQDFIVQILSERTLDSFLQEKRFKTEDAKRAGEALKTLLGLDAVGAGFVVAARGLRESYDSTLFTLVQVSIYDKDSYVGTLSLGDDGTLVLGADPWVKDDLFNVAQNTQAPAQPRKYRYLDAIYSAAIRNKVPTGIVGEAMMLLSRTHDLDAFADEDDELVLVYSDTPRDPESNTGRVLYAAIRTGDKQLDCYVFREKPTADYGCETEAVVEHSVTIQNGMVTPVNGVLTSGFGPRKHPLLKEVRIHKGVDWAAPTGTPVFAAFEGTVVFAGDGEGYGNFIKIKHKNNTATGYAHLNGFAGGIAKGSTVKAGDVIGYVGTTGLSTGPHLHFEFYRGTVAVDPLGTPSSGGSAAAEILVAKIVRVESAGRADAKNPLSTATGLGQFIESTWLRMIRTYRPELAKSLSRDEILALRTDPTLSREMVHNLARENEAKLKSRGHSITAGRLYLAHFLGPDGANTVLSADAGAALLELLGAPVINANPFLTGKDAAWVIDWAERKMAGRGKYTAPAITKKTVRTRSKAFVAYKSAVDEALVAMNSQF